MKLRLNLLARVILVVLLLVSAGNFAIIQSAFYEFDERVDELRQLNLVIQSTQRIKNRLIDTETGQRGYLLTGDKAYLTPYFEGQKIAHEEFQKLLQLTMQSAEHQQRLGTIKKLIDKKTRELQQTIDLYDAGRTKEAMALVKRDVGKNYMDQIREEMAVITSTEQNKLNNQRVEFEHFKARTQGWFFTTGVLALIAAVTIYQIVKKRIIRPIEELAKEVKNFGEGKDFSPDDGKSAEEIHLLADAFAKMANALQVKQAELARAFKQAKEANHALEASNKELESFSYSVSHDLRAPLRAIDGFSTILMKSQQDKLDSEGQMLLTRMRAAAQRMSQLIDDMLVLSRITRSEIAKEHLNLSKLAQAAFSQLQEAYPERVVRANIKPDIYAEADPRLIRIVLNNLIGNAWKFTSKSPGALIEFGSRTENGLTEYFVKDNGAGFDMTYADKLFGAFQRLHSSNDYPGNGIGLATVVRVIHKHGGSVRAEGKVDAGATFWFSLSS